MEVITIRSRKFVVYFMLSMMVVHTFFFPIQSFASTEINNKQVETNDQSFKKAIIVADYEHEVALFEKMDEDSEKLISLSNEDEVKLRKKEEEFSLIEVVIDNEEIDENNDQDQQEIWQGFIINDFLEIIDEIGRASCRERV